jgi:monoamine oxidase
MREPAIIIIGAGAAGLAAAWHLAEAGVVSTILEARNRIGGRIWTAHSQPGNLPIELGPEFIHGEKVETWDFIQKAGLGTEEVPDRHWQAMDGAMIQKPDFWEQLEKVFERINRRDPDTPVEIFLSHNPDLDPEIRWLAKEYVEGFHAAPVQKMSVQALALAEEAAEKEAGTKQFRIVEGYSRLVDWFTASLRASGVEIRCGQKVAEVCWERDQVEVITGNVGEEQSHRADLCLVTIPLSVLQRQAVTFEPGLGEKEKAIQSLAMSQVIRVNLRFQERFWPVENFGFLHTDDERFPTWWSEPHGPRITGWAGGSRAERLSGENDETLVSEAIAALARVLRMEKRMVADQLAESWTHNWSADEFALGAYSYTPVGMLEMPGRLAEPLADTLFFAGEATNDTGDQGTVHGALASGKRAAKEILKRLHTGSFAKIATRRNLSL